MNLFFTTTAIFMIVIFLMAIGVIIGKVQIKGSCGGLGGCGLCFFKGRKECPRNREVDESLTNAVNKNQTKDRSILMNDFGD